MSKPRKILYGSILGILLILFQGVLVLYRTKIIIEIYGVEINSISQSIQNLFSYLILLESGAGAAYLFEMYKPYTNKDDIKVLGLFKGLQNTLKKIFLIMISIIVILSLIYPFVLTVLDVSYIRILLMVLILGLRFSLPYYFVIAKKNLLILKEKQYIVNIIDGTINITIILIELLLISFFSLPIEVVLLTGIALIFVSNYVYNYITNYKNIIDLAKEAVPIYEQNKLTRVIFIHQFTGLMTNNINVFFLSLFNLISVTIYTSYSIIMNLPISIVDRIIGNLRATIGLKISKSDKNIHKLFYELLSINFFIAIIITTVFVVMINDFIVIWIGEQFTLGLLPVYLFGAILFHSLINPTIYATRDGMALYRESKNYTIITALLNIVLALIFYPILGILGLLLSTVATTYFIKDIGNINLIHSKIFNKSPRKLYIEILLVIISMVLVISINKYLLSLFSLQFSVLFNFIIEASIVTIFTSLYTLFVLMIIDKNFVNAYKKILSSILT